MSVEIRKYLSEIGRRGGRKSRRKLDPVTARKMVVIREARRAYRTFHAMCFWSYDPDLQIGLNDVPWVVEQLRKYGNHKAWEVAARLCL